MYLSNLSNGTKLTITYEDGATYNCVIEGKIDHMSFFVHCVDLFSRIDDFVGTTPMFKFYSNEKFYTFTGEILGKSTSKHAMVDTIDVLIKTPFKEGTDRKEFRIETNMKVRIFEYVDDYKTLNAGEWICDTQARDISKNGIKLWSDFKISEPLDTLFSLELKLSRDGSLVVPARLVRTIKAIGDKKAEG